MADAEAEENMGRGSTRVCARTISAQKGPPTHTHTRTHSKERMEGRAVLSYWGWGLRREPHHTQPQSDVPQPAAGSRTTRGEEDADWFYGTRAEYPIQS